MLKFKVLCQMHKYADLSDKGVERWLPSEGEDEDDAVYRLRELVDEERRENARQAGVSEQYGSAEVVGKSGRRLYVGAIGFGQRVRPAGTVTPKVHRPKVLSRPESRTYTRVHKYTEEELRQASIQDLNSDIRAAVRDGQHEYAEQCRRELAKLRNR
jgi:hypothetical protein